MDLLGELVDIHMILVVSKIVSQSYLSHILFISPFGNFQALCVAKDHMHGETENFTYAVTNINYVLL